MLNIDKVFSKSFYNLKLYISAGIQTWIVRQNVSKARWPTVPRERESLRKKNFSIHFVASSRQSLLTEKKVKMYLLSRLHCKRCSKFLLSLNEIKFLLEWDNFGQVARASEWVHFQRISDSEEFQNVSLDYNNNNGSLIEYPPYGCSSIGR